MAVLGVSARDVADAHWLVATYSHTDFKISDSSPFQQLDVHELFHHPWDVIERIYPGTADIFDSMGWEKLTSIDRV
jgi:hypothetical protein